MSEKPTTSEITQANKEILQAIATDEALFKDFLAVMAQHTGRDRRRLADGTWENLDDQSVLNCAAIQASSYEDTREVMTESEWKKVFPDASVREGEPGIPVVKSSSTGKHFWVDSLYPASAMENLPEGYYRNLPSRINLSDDVDARCWEAATKADLKLYRSVLNDEGKRVFEGGKPVREELPVTFDEIDKNVAFIVSSHFGLEPGEIELPPEGIVDDTFALKAYCNGIKADARTLLAQLSRAFDRELSLVTGEVRSEGVSQDTPASAQKENAAIADNAKYMGINPSASIVDKAKDLGIDPFAPRAASPSAPDHPVPIDELIPSAMEDASPYVAEGRSPADNARAAREAAARAAAQPEAAQTQACHP